MRFFYNLFIHLYPLFIRIASIWNPKARLWIAGRKNQFERLKIAVGTSNKPIIWFHSASLGEFEQGRPVLESIREAYPSYRILVTFFSPSGFEIRKKYKGADLIFYMPIDSRSNAKKFIEITNPKLAVFIKYEFWHYFLKSLNNQKIPTILISAIFHQHHFKYKIWSDFFKKTLSFFSHIFVQNNKSLLLLHEKQVNTNYSLGGDTRYDRVKALSEQALNNQKINAFCNNQFVLVAGSTWHDDELAIQKIQKNISGFKLIIAPHEISEKHIRSISDLFPDALLFSELDKVSHPESHSVLIIDCIGILSKLYRHATIAYVGGGFNRSGIHNILEAAVYGKVVLFGPEFRRSNEAKEMIELGLAYSFSNQEGLERIITKLLNSPLELDEKNQASKQFVLERTGATSIILKHIKDNHLL